jgi:predicted nucleic acid-binding protein
MKYWDSSALVSIVVEEPRTPLLRTMRQDDPEQTVWCLSEVEIAAALARREREGADAGPIETAREGLSKLVRRWRPVTAVEAVRARALRLVRTHPLRAADALQLAAALVASDDKPEGMPFVCLDDRLRDAARREGFPVLP